MNLDEIYEKVDVLSFENTWVQPVSFFLVFCDILHTLLNMSKFDYYEKKA
jgi:hypothetical protein